MVHYCPEILPVITIVALVSSVSERNEKIAGIIKLASYLLLRSVPT